MPEHAIEEAKLTAEALQMSERSQEQVIDEIHRQREELVSAVAETRRDVIWEVDHLKSVAKRGLPVVGAVVGLLVATLVTRKLTHPRPKPKIPVERIRIGRFSLIEHV